MRTFSAHAVRGAIILGLTVVCLLVVARPTNAQKAFAPTFTVYLGFDDGPVPGKTDIILAILKKYHVHATFFIQGAHIRNNEAYLRRELLDGHHIGNHLVFHDPVIMVPATPPDSVLLNRYYQTDGAIRAALGDLGPIWDAEEPIKPFRWPGGAIRAFPLPNVITYNWNSTTADSREGGVTPIGAAENALYGYPPQHYYGVYAWGDGAVVLMHDESWSTIHALSTIIENLQANGVAFGVLPRPGDKPGTMPISLNDVPRCARQPGNCKAIYYRYLFSGSLPTS